MANNKMLVDNKKLLGKISIQATFNNTILSLSSSEGNVVGWASGGSVGYKGSQRGSAQAAQLAGETIGVKSLKNGFKHVYVTVKGLGPGRLSALKGLRKSQLVIHYLEDKTSVPFGGCRPRKSRRLKSKRR